MSEKICGTIFDWILPRSDFSEVDEMCGVVGCEMLAKILLERGMTPKLIEGFLNPPLVFSEILTDLDASARRAISAVQNNEKICIFGDYDVDGLTSAAVLFHVLKAMEVEPFCIIPRRADGYGPSFTHIDEFRAREADLLFIVDSGSNAVDVVEYAQKFMDVIVLDHHPISGKVPNCLACVNPYRDDVKEWRNMAAVGVTFCFVNLFVKLLKDCGTSFPWDHMDLLGFVALGTVCDVMPITGLNRAIVKRGLMCLDKFPGLSAISALDRGHGMSKLGFGIGPRINAAGRVGDPSVAMGALSTMDAVEADHLAIQLDKYNNQRREMERIVLEEAVAAVDISQKVLCVRGGGWDLGVVGIVAARIRDLHHRPVFVVSFDADSAVGSGSARGTSEVSVGNIVHDALKSDLILGGGGHDMAAGIKVSEDQWESFCAFAQDCVPEISRRSVKIDTEVDLSHLDEISEIKLLEPYGKGNPKPTFLISNLRVISCQIMKEKHIALNVSQWNVRSRMVAFNVMPSSLGDILTQSRTLDVVASWNDSSFVIIDAIPSAKLGIFA